jgi:hypothetical protein
MKASSSKLVPFEVGSMDGLGPNDTHIDIGDIVLLVFATKILYTTHHRLEWDVIDEK